MTATTAEGPAATRGTGPTGAFVGTATLVRFQVRRDRVKLPGWVAGFGLFIVYLAAALPQVAETEADLASTTALFRDPVGRLLTGPGYGFDAPTYERLVAGGYSLYLLILAALMSILLVVRHSRLEEQTGRAELVRANVVGRHALLSATLVVAVVTNLAVAAVVALAMITVGGWGVTGSLLTAASVAAVGLAFAGVAAVTVQLSRYPRAASGTAGAALGLAFVLRAGGDMAAEGGGALSWLSPLGWGQQTAPFVLDRWWPLVLPLALAVLTTGVGFVLSNRRDLGASLVADRPGRAHAAPSLGTPLGLAWRLQRGNATGWTLGLVVGGLAFGAYADALIGAADQLPDVFTELFTGDDLVAGYLAYMATFMAYLAGAYAVSVARGWRNEETAGRAEPVLATPIGRLRWFGANVAVAAVVVVVALGLTGAATGVGAALVTGTWSYVGEMTVAHLNQVPAVWLVLGVGVALFGALPRAVGAAWVLVGFGLFVGTFGDLLQLPAGVLALSPFAHPAELPIEPFAATPLLVLTGLAVAATAFGLAAYGRRAITSAG
ncbi:hypothetical protein FTX61_08145 [Nitriliruptoraceae bacterium ZYF776]|nr:hypothetical protein [Profundirhabdus halotolerans]